MSSMEQHLQQEIGQNMFGERSSIPLEKKWKSLSSSANAMDEGENNPIEGFDCNICLDPVQDPVVTFCGHLYCWPCIYKWIHSQTVLSELDTDEHKQHPQCPVCKDEVSEKTLIPLYGRGLAPKSSSEMTIPQRPQSPRCGGHVLLPLPTTTATSSPLSPLRSHPQPPPPLVHQQPYHPNTFIGSALQQGGTTANWMFGEMVYTRMFGGNSETTLYSYPNSYNNLAAGSNLRMRRQMMNADRSLSRICFFLFCCLVLCVLLF